LDHQALRQKLQDAGIPNAEREARWMLDGIPAARVADALNRRLAGEPLSRILGNQEFWGLGFELSPDTLDPRADTETLIQAALNRFKGRPPKRILDIGTGTGCILITLLHEWPETTGVATDISAGALETARRNATLNGVADRAEFIQTSWAAGVTGSFDLILSNPPYIPTAVIPNLDENVQNYDPILALDGGADGLDAYRFILTEIKTLLNPGGYALFEIGYDQAESMPRIVEESGATPENIIRDSGGNPRVVECRMGISEKTIASDS